MPAIWVVRRPSLIFFEGLLKNIQKHLDGLDWGAIIVGFVGAEAATDL
jgi:hypothetical protein